jgi:hypothetical protein
MTPTQFREWKSLMGFTNETAGHALGLSKHTVGDYCRDMRRGRYAGLETKIPHHVALACAAVRLGIVDYPE